MPNECHLVSIVYSKTETIFGKIDTDDDLIAELVHGESEAFSGTAPRQALWHQAIHKGSPGAYCIRISLHIKPECPSGFSRNIIYDPCTNPLVLVWECFLYSILHPIPKKAKRSGSFDVSAGYLFPSPLGPFLLLLAGLVNLFSF
jgi:hypothetical protein